MALENTERAAGIEANSFLTEVSSHDKRYCVFAGTEGWPLEAKVGETVVLRLYESLQDRFLDVIVKIDSVERPNIDQLELRGEAVVDFMYYRSTPTMGFYNYYPYKQSAMAKQRYRATVTMFHRHVGSSGVVLIPDYE